MALLGVNIDLLNDYKDTDLLNDDNDSEDERLDAKIVNDFHFEGFEDGPTNGRKKTKQEIFKEIIGKSKKEKYHR